LRCDIIITGIIFFFIGLTTTIIAFTVLKEYRIEKLVVDLVGIIGFLYLFFSIPTILIGFFMSEKPKVFLK
jgi:hypothetical protein